jgi:cytoskeletal protein CcmA (bactofilin family)
MLLVETESVIRGKLKAAGKMRLDCWLEGEIVCSRLEIGPGGYVLGNVTARELFVEGQIVGQIEASVVHLMEGAFVEGDIHHSVISIHPTATLLGKAVRTQGFSPSELVALEEKSAAGRNDLEGECRANAKITGVDWSRYQPARAS